jgi:hypothetical protein
MDAVLETPEDGEDELIADLEQFATFDKKVGWALAYLVARRVEPEKGTGVSVEQQSKRCARTTFRRISAREFARRAGTSHKRVMAYLRAWQRAVDDGIVPPAGTLDRSAAVDLPDERSTPFFGEGGYYRGHEAYEMSEERLDRIEREAQLIGIKPHSTAYVAAHPKAVMAAILADENTYKAAQEGFAEYERRQQESDRADRAANTQAKAAQLRSEDDQDLADNNLGQAVPGADNSPGQETAILVLQELTAAKLGAARALALLKKHSIVFSEERSAAIIDACDGTCAALELVRGLTVSNTTALSDVALQAFLEESEKL